MPKEINFTPRSKLKIGLDKVVDSVKITIGPKGRNVGIEQGGTPIIANDGGIIAKFINLKDPVENMGAQIAQDVIAKTSEEVGGGRTASAILTQSIVNEGIKALDKGMNINSLHKGMLQAQKDIVASLKNISKEITTPEEIKQIATISTESEELGSIIAEVINKVGKNCDVKVEDSNTIGITYKIENGFKFDKGWISPYMITDPQKMESNFKDVSILVTDKKISVYNEIKPIIDKQLSNGENTLVVICEDFDGEALNAITMLKLKQVFNLLAIKIPGFSDKKEWLEDIALCTGAQIATDSTQTKIAEATLGTIKDITSTKDSTLLLGTVDTKEKANELSILKDSTDSKYEKDKIEKRIAILNGSVAVIKVGAATDSELKYLKLKIEDGINESKRALEEGIVSGGNVAFIQAKMQTTLNLSIDSDFNLGYGIVLKAIEAPLRQIVSNANGSSDLIISKITQTNGYNANTNEIIDDMFSSGIIDAVKVCRIALRNAISGAFTFLTLEATVTEEITNEE